MCSDLRPAINQLILCTGNVDNCILGKHAFWLLIIYLTSTGYLILYVVNLIKIFFFVQGFRADPRFLTARDKAYKRVVNDTSIFKVRPTTSDNVPVRVHICR